MTAIAVMQPYFLPYIGYFQLMAAADKFIVFDDVNFIKRGWINRNRLLLNGQAHTFTVPLRHASQNRLICELALAEDENWREKLLRTVRQAYVRAPHFAQAFALAERVIAYPSNRLDAFLLNSLREIARHLALRTEIVDSSRAYGNSHLKGQERIIDICRQESAKVYLNAIGGLDLYRPEAFEGPGVSLRFVRSRPLRYDQGHGPHVAWLSILDVLMFNGPADVRRLLEERDFVGGDGEPCRG